uniref:ZU5 domain-containing protein n=1 Tax=Timema douglasi TaxID=61478 RepID=A0A7R8VE85_TIMDO|nr:unnamed protein product [Timema douglasi]
MWVMYEPVHRRHVANSLVEHYLAKTKVAAVLLEHGASLTATTKKGFTPLHLAAKYGNMKVAKLVLQRDAPVDAQGKNGVTPLHVASHYDHQNVALLLLDKGASPHATAKNGHTPLHIAARKNQMDIATTLLEYGAKANAESKAGFTPLHLSSQEGHTDMSTLLIEHQADTNHKAKNGLTPLHLCAQEDRVNVAAILVKNGAQVESITKAGYTPLHVASHFGQGNMVRFLLQQGGDVKASTNIGYTPLHQASQQGHTTIVNLLLENAAQPNSVTSQGQTALSIAQKLGYISVVESLKVVTDPSVSSNATLGADEKYRVVAPESMQEIFMSDSEDEGGEFACSGHELVMWGVWYVEDMCGDLESESCWKEGQGVGEDDDEAEPELVPSDEALDSGVYGKPAHARHVYLPYYEGQMLLTPPPTAVDDTISPQHTKDTYQQFAVNYTPDNVDIGRHPLNVGDAELQTQWRARDCASTQDYSAHEYVVFLSSSFLVSFLVDARGGAMRGCRHSGVRVIVPPRKATMPMRVTCRYLKRDKLSHPPPLMEGEALASRILELGPVGAKFLGPVIIEVPHFGSLRGMEREIVILRSDNGETWREHTLEASDDAVHQVLNDSFEGEELSALEEVNAGRTTRILTTDFPQYFAVVSRIRQEVHAIGPEGGMVSSSVVPQVQAVFPQGALTKKIKVGLQVNLFKPRKGASAGMLKKITVNHLPKKKRFSLVW